MEAKNADLTALRINRSPEPAGAAPTRRTGRWLAIGLPAAAILVLAAVGLISARALGSAIPGHLTPPAGGAPGPAGAGLVPPGSDVAQRKGSGAASGTGR